METPVAPHSSSPAESENSVIKGPLEFPASFSSKPRKNRGGRKGGVRRHLQTPLPDSLAVYWHKRYLLFSRFDEGVQMEGEDWFSTTPESIAAHIARRCGFPDAVLLDMFAGAGGNVIQFAKTCAHVMAADLDPVKLRRAAHNATVYGVRARIDFVNADSVTLLRRAKVDVVFLAPPWGGPGYQRHDVFDLAFITSPMDGAELFRLAAAAAPNVAYFLPRNVSAAQVAALALPGQTCVIEDNFVGPKLMSVTAYFGPIADRIRALKAS